MLVFPCIIWNAHIIIASQREVFIMSTRIKELRLAQDMTLLEVADRLGVSESTVQRYESGAIANLKYDTIIDLANLFGVDPCYLMGWTSPLHEKDFSEISDEEMRLLSFYRSLNVVGKKRALQDLEDLAQIDRYKKVSDSGRDAV